MAEQILEHFSAVPVDQVRSLSQDEESVGYAKPAGLWLSVRGEDDWPSWCESEQWGLEGLAYRYVVHLSATANLLWLQGSHALDTFHEQFARPDSEMPGIGFRGLWNIDWHAVAELYDGIIIAPYVWERRLSGPVSDWYYGWNCASGVIWNADAVQRLELITQAARAA